MSESGTMASSDFTLYGVTLRSRLMLGTSQYPSPAVLAEAVRASGAEIRHRLAARASPRGSSEGQDFWRLIRDTRRPRVCPTRRAATA